MLALVCRLDTSLGSQLLRGWYHSWSTATQELAVAPLCSTARWIQCRGISPNINDMHRYMHGVRHCISHYGRSGAGNKDVAFKKSLQWRKTHQIAEHHEAGLTSTGRMHLAWYFLCATDPAYLDPQPSQCMSI